MSIKQIRIDPVPALSAVPVVLLLVSVPFLYTVITGDFPGAHLFYGMEEDSWLSITLLNLHAEMVATFAGIWQSVLSFFS